MNVKELIEELKKLDPEMKVCVGIGCSCYGSGVASEITIMEDPSLYPSKELVAFIEGP